MLLLSTPGLAQQLISIHSLLNEITDVTSVARWPSPAYIEKQSGSYDRRSVSPDKPEWFANADANQFIRAEKKDGHTEYVMMDAEGPERSCVFG